MSASLKKSYKNIDNLDDEIEISLSKIHKKFHNSFKSKSINDNLKLVENYYRQVNYFRNIGRKFIVDEELSKKILSILISIFVSMLKKFDFLYLNNKSSIRLLALNEDPFNTYLLFDG